MDFEFILIIAFVLISIWFLVKKAPPSNCSGNCNQGRNCDCGPNKKEQTIEWKK